jgi:hypothetical protein
MHQIKRANKLKQDRGTNMDMRKYAGGNYLRVDDVRDGPRRLTIVRVKAGNYDKPEAIFNDGSILSLNGGNVRVLSRSYSRQ